MRRLATLSPLILLLLAGCNRYGGAQDATAPVEGRKPTNYAGIAADETLRFTGTEPFWGGQVTGDRLTYTTPDTPGGTPIAVRRFAGNNGLAFSGRLAVGSGAANFDMAVTEAPCSDGMSDRAYPFTVSLTIGGDKRSGCGWTARRGFTGPAKP